MAPRIVLATVVLVLATCGGSPDSSDVTVPARPPDCETAYPAEVIASHGCMDGTEFEAVAVFTCGRGRLLYGIGNRWAFAGDDVWTVGGQPLWDICRPDA